MTDFLPRLSGDRRQATGDRRAAALRAYLAATEAMSVAAAPGEVFGDLLRDPPRRSDRWPVCMTASVRKAAEYEVLAAAVPGLDGIARRFIARLEASPEPERCIVHRDIYPPNVMMKDDLQVTGLIDFSIGTRIGDHDYVKQLIKARHGAEVMDRIDLYVVWFAFDFACNHDDAMVFARCADLTRDSGAN